MHLGELGAVDHLVHRHDPGGELAQAAGGEAADEVLGEHRQALLGLLVAGQPLASVRSGWCEPLT